MSRFLYTALYYLLLPAIIGRLLYRGIKAPAYWSRIPERFGFFKAPVMEGCLWVHSVSVGETIAAEPLVRGLMAENSNLKVTITTMTPTGSAQVLNIYKEEIAQGKVFHLYAPYDLPCVLKPFLRKVKPKTLVIMETELWPNMIHYANHAGVSVVVANARLSERSAKGYGKVKSLSADMLSKVDTVAVQTAVEGQRFVELGLPASAVTVTGSIKFDVTVDELMQQQADELKQQWQINGRPVWIAASTHEGEDATALEAHQHLLKKAPNAILLLVPRHPERFEKVFQQSQVLLPTEKRSDIAGAVAKDTSVIVGNTMGEMQLFLGVSDVAFVGGSLVARGGHNTLEPAAWKLPIMSGPHVFNFQNINQLLTDAEGLVTVNNAAELTEQIEQWFTDDKARKIVGSNAYSVVENNQGALRKLMALIDDLD